MTHFDSNAVRKPHDSPPERYHGVTVGFPEADFAPVTSLAKAYWENVRRGTHVMAQRRVVIAGLARNIAGILPFSISRAESLGRCFADFRILVYENDSSDDTLPILQQWQAENSKVHVVSESLGDECHPQTRSLRRADRMAYYRSECQRHILNRWGEFDEVILLDWDVVGGWSLLGIANSYGHSDWDFVGSNGLICRRLGWNPNRYQQYDAWAFRIDEDFKPLTAKQVNKLSYRPGEAFVPLTSCFGGLGIYRMDAYRSGRYHGGDIEHVAMHRSMREQGFGRIYLNPSQITLYGRRHLLLDKYIHGIQDLGARLRLLPPPKWIFPRNP